MSKVVVSGRYEVQKSHPLPELDTPTATAFAVVDQQQSDLPLYALKTNIFPSPRLSILESLNALHRDNPNLKIVKLVHSANISWNDDSPARSLILIYQKPPGTKITSHISHPFTAWSEEQITSKVLIPIYEILEIFKRHNISHRVIRPDNIFLDTTAGQSPVTLGECVSMPPGYAYGNLFEPLSHAVAHPVARGETTIANDIYALGVLVCFLLNGGNTCHLTDDIKVLQQRILQGSFLTFSPKKSLSTGYQELLRALLTDNNEHRWSLKELGNWLTTGRQAHVVSQPVRRATRPISFDGQEEIYTTALLGFEMRRNPNAAVDLIVKNELLAWLKNSLNDHIRVQQLEGLRTITPVSASGGERLLAVLQILDRGSPLFWAGKSFTFNGLGHYIASALYSNEHSESLQKLISSPIFSYVVGDNENVLKKLQTAKSYVEHRTLGGGIERCLYYLCPDVPCLSPFIKIYNVLHVSELLSALNHIGMTHHKPEFPIDRHIAAFLLANGSHAYQGFLHEMESRSTFKRITALLNLLSELQIKYKTYKLSGLCKWLVELSESVIQSYNNIYLQEHLRKKLESLVEAGDITAILKVIDNNKALEADRLALKQAQVEAQNIEKRVKNLHTTLNSPTHYSEKIGQNNAMILSTILAMGFSLIAVIAKVVV